MPRRSIMCTPTKFEINPLSNLPANQRPGNGTDSTEYDRSLLKLYESNDHYLDWSQLHRYQTCRLFLLSSNNLWVFNREWCVLIWVHQAHLGSIRLLVCLKLRGLDQPHSPEIIENSAEHVQSFIWSEVFHYDFIQHIRFWNPMINLSASVESMEIVLRINESYYGIYLHSASSLCIVFAAREGAAITATDTTTRHQRYAMLTTGTNSNWKKSIHVLWSSIAQFISCNVELNKIMYTMN